MDFIGLKIVGGLLGCGLGYYIYTRVRGQSTVDQFIKTGTALIKKIETYVEHKAKEANVYDAAVTAATKLKADGEAEIERAKAFVEKLKGTFN